MVMMIIQHVDVIECSSALCDVENVVIYQVWMSNALSVRLCDVLCCITYSD